MEAWRKLGGTKHHGILYFRAKRRIKVITSRRRKCFESLSYSRLAALLKQKTGHTQPIGHSKEAVVDRLLELRVPVPQVSSRSSDEFVRALYQIMKR